MEFNETENLIDARGRCVPIPVGEIESRLLQSNLPYLVMVVNTPKDRENIIALAESMDYRVKVYNEGQDYYIRIEKEEDVGLPVDLSTDFEQVLLVTSDQWGTGDEALGKQLLHLFFNELTDGGVLPQSIVFVNSGVKLACEASEILSELLDLERRSVRIFTCEKSLEFYGLKHKLCVGSVVKTFHLVYYLTTAPKVLTLG